MRMRLLLAGLLVAGCSPQAPVATDPATAGAPVRPVAGDQGPAIAPAAIEAVDASPRREPRLVRTQRHGIEIEAVAFDARSHRLVIADQPGGPGSRWADAAAAGRAMGGLASANAGFFTPEGKPLGLVVVDGRREGAVNRASSLGAGFYVERNGGMDLARRERFGGGDQALQSGPFLVEAGRAVGGLSERRSSARTFLATDGRSGWILARSGACSLAELARALAGETLAGVRVAHALNLDGGRSSDLWVSDRVAGGPASSRPFWNKPVRNFLVLKPR